ncbi:hypothetical protein L3Q82_020155, partial [Scortum barcoo]
LPAIDVSNLEKAKRLDTVGQMENTYNLHGALKVTKNAGCVPANSYCLWSPSQEVQQPVAQMPAARVLTKNQEKRPYYSSIWLLCIGSL